MHKASVEYFLFFHVNGAKPVVGPRKDRQRRIRRLVEGASPQINQIVQVARRVQWASQRTAPAESAVVASTPTSAKEAGRGRIERATASMHTFFENK